MAAAATILVLAAGMFFLVHREDMAGLGERFLFAASALWMVVNVRLAGRSGPASDIDT